MTRTTVTSMTNAPRKPALSVIATPTKRRTIIDLAIEADERGFSGLALPSLGGTMGLAVSLAHSTRSIRFWTSIQPIYYSHPVETGNIAAHINEVSDGRFALGLGVSHGPVVKRLNVNTGKPLADIENYVEAMRANEKTSGPLPHIYLATLRDKMLALASRVSDGAVWANASRSHMATQLGSLDSAMTSRMFLANMIPTVIDEDQAAADAVNRRTLLGYVILPNYRNYWRGAGYVEEMDRIEAALSAGDKDSVLTAMSDDWLHDCTLGGNATFVRDGLEAWFDEGVTPIAVMSSTSGGQVKAIGELFDAYS